MHACSVCHKACDCGGDNGQVISIQEMPGCTCCLNTCEHSVEFGFHCGACDVDPPIVSPTPSRNGGW